MTDYEKVAMWLVYSREHNLWWCPNSAGYTCDIAQAGRYSKAEADRICADAGRGRGAHRGDGDEGPPEFAVPAPESVDALRKAAEVPEPDMWWDLEYPETCLDDPWEAVDGNEYMKPGDTFRLDCAKKLPSRVYAVTDDGENVRDATPQEVAEHEAHERKQAAERKAKFAAENAARRAAESATRAAAEAARKEAADGH